MSLNNYLISALMKKNIQKVFSSLEKCFFLPRLEGSSADDW
jgi:hypothetical protein